MSDETPIAETLKHWVEAIRTPTVANTTFADAALFNGGCITDDLETAVAKLTRLQQSNAALVEALGIVKLYIKDEGIAHAVVPPRGEIPHGKMPTLLNVVESALANA